MAREVNTEALKDATAIAKKTVDEKLAIVKKALTDKHLTDYNKGIEALGKAIKDYNEYLCKLEYVKFLAEENPMIAAVKQFYVDTVKIKETRDKEDGSITGVSLEEKKSRIDLEKFCEFAELDRAWAHDSTKLLTLFTLRETDVFAMKPDELAKKSIYFISQARAKKEGETPDSNRQIVLLLQKIIDEAIFVDNGKGENAYKCTNHDIAFIHDAVTKIDTKEKCTIATLNPRQFKTVMMSVFAHCLGEAYKVKAKTKEA